MATHATDLSPELIIQPWQGGIKLLRPHPHQVSYTNISDLDKLPFSCYFIDTKSAIEYVNCACAQANHFNSPRAAYGKHVLEYVEKNSALISLQDDQSVLSKQQKMITEQEHKLLNGLAYFYLTIKLPWYDNNGILKGVFGSSIAMEGQSLAGSLQIIANMGLLAPTLSNNILKIEHTYLSKRESECLWHLVRGKSCKQIAKRLNLSPRTIEYYLENIKIKLGVANKAELIEKASAILINNIN